jgi:hypothetical protein
MIKYLALVVTSLPRKFWLDLTPYLFALWTLPQVVSVGLHICIT